MRRELKKRGVKKLKVVYSEEPAMTPVEDMAISCRANCICPPGEKHKCTERRAIPGSVAFVPSVVGLILQVKLSKIYRYNFDVGYLTHVFYRKIFWTK